MPRDWGPFQFGPAFKCDKFGLPTKFDNIKQPNWIHNRRKFLSSLNFQERNIVLTGDPFIEFDPATYICIYTAPQEVSDAQVGGDTQTTPTTIQDTQVQDSGTQQVSETQVSETQVPDTQVPKLIII